jgi:hypothetical protein
MMRKHTAILPQITHKVALYVTFQRAATAATILVQLYMFSQNNLCIHAHGMHTHVCTSIITSELDSSVAPQYLMLQ